MSHNLSVQLDAISLCASDASTHLQDSVERTRAQLAEDVVEARVRAVASTDQLGTGEVEGRDEAASHWQELRRNRRTRRAVRTRQRHRPRRLTS